MQTLCFAYKSLKKKFGRKCWKIMMQQKKISVHLQNWRKLLPHKKERKKEIRKRHFIQFSLHITLKRNIGRNIRNYMYIFTVYKKTVIYKGIKV